MPESLMERAFEVALHSGTLVVALDAAKTQITTEAGRRIIRELLAADTVPFGTGAFLTAAKVAWWVYKDPKFTAACAERAEEIELWRECARIWYLMKDDPAHGAHARLAMARAARECIARLVGDGEFSEAAFVVEPFHTTTEEKAAAYRDLYDIFLEVGEPLQAAWLGCRKHTPAIGITAEDVRRAAVAAYLNALKDQEPLIEGDDDLPDRELIILEFGLLAKEDHTA